MSDKAKNILIIVLLAIIVIESAFFASELSTNKSKEPSVQLTNISLKEYKEIYAKEGNNIVYIGKTSCTYCQKFNPIMLSIARDKELTVNYINLDNLSEDEMNELYDSNSFFETEEWGTPLLLVVGENKIKTYNIGYTDKDTTLNFLVNAGVINE